MDLDNPVISLCIAGVQAEFQRRLEDARDLYRQAWRIASDDYEACIAAHYVARFQDSPQDALAWNQEALKRANAVADERVTAFYASLYVNVGHSYEVLGRVVEAQQYYNLAAELGLQHQTE